MNKHKILVDCDLCIGCGLCANDCPVNNIDVLDKKANIIEQDCVECGHCVAICPKAAIAMTNFQEMPVEFQQQTRLDPDQLLEAIRTRRTIRQFKNNLPVSKDVIQQILEAGRLTPSGSNAQDVSYIVLHDNIQQYEALAVKFFRRILPIAKLVNKAARKVPIDNHFFFKKAPVVIVITSKDKINASLASANMALMAEANGFGVLYSGFFCMSVNMSRKLRNAIGVKSGDKAIATLVIGYSDVIYRRSAQKDVADIRYL